MKNFFHFRLSIYFVIFCCSILLGLLLTNKCLKCNVSKETFDTKSEPLFNVSLNKNVQLSYYMSQKVKRNDLDRYMWQKVKRNDLQSFTWFLKFWVYCFRCRLQNKHMRL